jgi:hypothetical protein
MTTLDKIRDMVRQSTADDWNKIEEGPTYRNRFGYSKGPGKQWRLEEDSHHTILVYKPDVDLTIAYGMHYQSQGRDEAEYEWSQAFASTSVRTGFADIFWRGSLIDRVDYAIVDDHQGVLPLGGGADGLKVTSLQVDVARLLHGITGKMNKFDYFFDRVPFEITE